MTRIVFRSGAIVALAFSMTACEKQLEVTNPNNPETARVLATPADAEALLGGYYKRWHAGLFANRSNVRGIANMLSFENYSSLANDCQNARTPFTGVSNTNNPGNVCQGNQSGVYFVEGEVNRVASSILKQLDDPAFTLGSTARDARARAFAEFLRGMSLGYVAVLYDSSAVVSAAMSSSDAGSLVGYQEVMDSAMVAFERAINAATDGTVTGSNGFPLPSDWIPSPTSWTSANFVRLIRSYRARLATQVARSPAERDALCWTTIAGGRTCATANWANVIADAQNGITADHFNTMSTTGGPFNSWVSQYDRYGLWHQMPAFIIGMADGSSGNYDTWVQTDISARALPFFMQTPDLRFPQGASRAAQQSDFKLSTCESAGATCKRYFVNRASGGDQNVGAGWGFSNYDFVRFHPWRLKGDAGSGRNGNLLFFAKAENDLLEAEGQFRLGQFNAATTIVNVTRTANGLAPLLLDGTGLTPAVDCVPRVPLGSGPSATLSCGTLWEALKYEKRIETAYTGFGMWFLDGRGWGDLAMGTPLFWATPYQDMLARGTPVSAIYGTGPATNPSNAPNSATTTVGTYGY